MNRLFGGSSKNIFCRIVVVFVLCAFGLGQPATGLAQSLSAPTVLGLPNPGAMINLTPGFLPATIRGLTIHPDDPFQFDFVIDSGQETFQEDELREESDKLIKYFMAALTVPEEEMWVNLSPYERDRIIPPAFGLTEMGRDLLAQDYLLKQLTASLMYPEKGLGKEFWERVKQRAIERFGKFDVSVDTFNKIWIVPNEAVVYEYEPTSTAFIVKSSLKVMLEEDYIALQNDIRENKEGMESLLEKQASSAVTSQVVREILLPEIEKEVNEGKTFANLRQIYHAMILATWYKNALRESILGKMYVDQNKVVGIDVEDKDIKEKIYDQYLAAFKKGVYDFIKEDYDPVNQQVIPRKYFSGGYSNRTANNAMLGEVIRESGRKINDPAMMTAALRGVTSRVADGVEKFLNFFLVRTSLATAGSGVEDLVDDGDGDLLDDEDIANQLEEEKSSRAGLGPLDEVVRRTITNNKIPVAIRARTLSIRLNGIEKEPGSLFDKKGLPYDSVYEILSGFNFIEENFAELDEKNRTEMKASLDKILDKSIKTILSAETTIAFDAVGDLGPNRRLYEMSNMDRVGNFLSGTQRLPVEQQLIIVEEILTDKKIQDYFSRGIIYSQALTRLRRAAPRANDSQKVEIRTLIDKLKAHIQSKSKPFTQVTEKTLEDRMDQVLRELDKRDSGKVNDLNVPKNYPFSTAATPVEVKAAANSAMLSIRVINSGKTVSDSLVFYLQGLGYGDVLAISDEDLVTTDLSGVDVVVTNLNDVGFINKEMERLRRIREKFAGKIVLSTAYPLNTEDEQSIWKNVQSIDAIDPSKIRVVSSVQPDAVIDAIDNAMSQRNNPSLSPTLAQRTDAIAKLFYPELQEELDNRKLRELKTVLFEELLRDRPNKASHWRLNVDDHLVTAVFNKGLELMGLSESEISSLYLILQKYNKKFMAPEEAKKADREIEDAISKRKNKSVSNKRVREILFILFGENAENGLWSELRGDFKITGNSWVAIPFTQGRDEVDGDDAMKSGVATATTEPIARTVSITDDDRQKVYAWLSEQISKSEVEGLVDVIVDSSALGAIGLSGPAIGDRVDAVLAEMNVYDTEEVTLQDIGKKRYIGAVATVEDFAVQNKFPKPAKPLATIATDSPVEAGQTNPAQLVDDTVGGIDLNAEMLNMQVKRDGSGIPLPVSQQPIINMNVEGFTPVIINIKPIPNLPMLLGINADNLPTEEISLNNPKISEIEI